MEALKNIIESAWEDRLDFSPERAPGQVSTAVDDCIEMLESGSVRVAEPGPDGWRVNEWLKKAVLLYFRISPNQVMAGGHTHYFDKVPVRWEEAVSYTHLTLPTTRRV